MRVIVGRLGTAYSISADIEYSAYPWPPLSEAKFDAIGDRAQKVLDARTPGETLDALYDPVSMPAKLVAAHAKLDRAVDDAYGRHRHTGDNTRLPVLLRRYNELSGREPSLFE